VTDEDKLARLVRALADNAVRHTVEGEVVLVARPAASGVTLEVRDSGPGIDPATGDGIFREGATSKPGHFGIGLALVEQVARRRGGWVHVTNDGGAVFRVALRTPGAQTEARSDEVEHLARARVHPERGSE